MMNDLVCAKLKEIVYMQDNIKTEELHYKPKCRKVYNFSECFLRIVF